MPQINKTGSREARTIELRLVVEVIGQISPGDLADAVTAMIEEVYGEVVEASAGIKPVHKPMTPEQEERLTQYRFIPDRDEYDIGYSENLEKEGSNE